MAEFNSTKLPWLVASDGNGNVFEIPGLEMVGMRINEKILPDPDELIPIPHGSVLVELPDRYPVGYDRKRDKFVTMKTYQGHPVIAAAVFMAPAYTQLYRAAYQTKSDAVKLPLFAYTPVGWKNDQFWATAIRVDDDIRQDLVHFNFDLIEKSAQQMMKRFPNNRLVAHLVNNCVRHYYCPAAQNFVLGRWECPVPTSPSCNAKCIGCISKQPEDGVPVTQDRITFVPTVEEILEFTVPHLGNAPRSIISFGQGCEGEPLLQAKLLEESIRQTRRFTSKGTINLNSNACYPDVIERLCHAGLDSIRVSLNSARPELYIKYYRPQDYSIEDVFESMKIMRQCNRWISLNYFIFPGLTDDPAEMEQLIKIVTDYRVDYIQMRNLNIDPEWYIQELELDLKTSKAIGILNWQRSVKEKAPWIRFGYYNPPKEDW
jgi:pyruvate-formate lyase-activating enzyme